MRASASRPGDLRPQGGGVSGSSRERRPAAHGRRSAPADGLLRRDQAAPPAAPLSETRRRLNKFDKSKPQVPPAAAVSTFAELWSTLSVEERRSVTTALLEQVRVNQDKIVVLVRAGAPAPR